MSPLFGRSIRRVLHKTIAPSLESKPSPASLDFTLRILLAPMAQGRCQTTACETQPPVNWERCLISFRITPRGKQHPVRPKNVCRELLRLVPCVCLSLDFRARWRRGRAAKDWCPRRVSCRPRAMASLSWSSCARTNGFAWSQGEVVWKLPRFGEGIFW